MATQTESETLETTASENAGHGHRTAVDKDGERVREMFSQIAPRYDLMNHLLSLGIDIRWRKRVLKELRLDGNKPVLDCCTGTGDLAIMLAEKMGGATEVVGTDFCPPMLEKAESKNRQRTAPLPIQFIEADTQHLPFESNRFQAVTVAFGLRNVQDTDRGIEELVRVCEPGGQVCVLEFSQPTMPVLKQVYHSYFMHVLPKVGQKFAKNNQSAYEYLPNSVMQFPSGEALVERLEDGGLENVRVIPMTLGVASIYIGDKVAPGGAD